MINRKPDAPSDGNDDRKVVSELSALRDLSQQLRSVAATAEDNVLRAILGKREALMGSIRVRLAEQEEEIAREGQSEKKKEIFKTISEIVDMDRESARLLKERAAQAAEEIKKIRAGRQFRESTRQWQ